MIHLKLTTIAARTAFALIALSACALMIYLAVAGFVIGVFSDGRYRVDRGQLAAAINRFPDSARLHYRFADLEMKSIDRDLSRAETYARNAVRLSPFNFNHHLLLSSVLEAKRDYPASEASLREAARLAPNDMETHWRLANLLVRQGRLDSSLEEFRRALASSATLLPASLDLVWRLSGSSVDAVRSIVSEDAAAKMILTRFLLKQSHPDEAVEVFNSIDPGSRLASAESPAMLQELINAGRVDLARKLWGELTAVATETLIRNPGFEEEFFKDFIQFDWQITRSPYARLGIDPTSGRTGSRSLLVEFIGRDTTRLDQEVRQLVLVEPGVRYRLSCYVKTDSLVSPQGPRIAVIDYKTGTLLAQSAPVSAGTSDWQSLEVDFLAPAAERRGGAAVYITIRRVPEFKYDDPTRGILWFDDFSISRQ